MKVAYLLPGFVRNLEYFDEIKRFLKLNSNHQIDLYSNTYDVLGSPHKEPSNKVGYKNSMKIDSEFLESFVPFKSINIENYEEVDREISEFSERYSYLINKSPQWSAKRTKKMGCLENEKTNIRSCYGQVRNVYKSFSLIEDIEDYDLIIKSRFDAWTSKLDLNLYGSVLEKNRIFGLDYYYIKNGKVCERNSTILDNGKQIPLICDLVVFGDSSSMQSWCSIDREKLIQIYSDQNLNSKDWETKHYGSDVKLNMEVIFSYNHFILNGGKKHVKINKDHLPDRGLLPRKKYR